METAVFYNTATRQLEPLEPMEPGHVRIYTCGPTVYNQAHIGNLRTFLFEDILRRSLKHLGYRVTQVMNLTDVDDKTIRGAQEAGVDLDTYTEPYIQAFFDDIDRLGFERAEEYPRATRHVAEMITMIETLLEKGFAYEQDGSVYFRIAQDDDYGKLSRIDTSQMRQGDRVASDEYEKEDVRDFVLWKGSRDSEPSWPSPWGDGRPGWHIECSAMSMKYLGESFDVHCGGVDNLFPHHENEIAQSESATGKPFVRCWLHSEHLLVDGAKMSKSLGNMYTLAELIERGVDPRAVRYLFLSVHYRQKLNFTFDSLEQASRRLRRLDEMRFRVEQSKEQGSPSVTVAEAVEKLSVGFKAALADDLNLSAALGALSTFAKAVNVAVETASLGEGDQQKILSALDSVDQVLGVLDPEPWAKDEQNSGDGESPSDEAIEELVQARQTARVERDFARSDELRDELESLGIVVEDTPSGPRWKRS